MSKASFLLLGISPKINFNQYEPTPYASKQTVNASIEKHTK
jgi:hypothetical protein